MVTPIIKSINVSFEEWGDEYDDFWITIEFDIGPTEGMGADVFTFNVTSPKRLGKIVALGEVESGRGLLIMNDYNFEKVTKLVSDLLKGIQQNTWSEVAMNIAKYARWEYDD